MVETELLIGQLRKQVRDLQSLLNYLESREAVKQDDYAYVHTKLHDSIGQLKNLERFSLQRETHSRLQAQWLN